MQWHIYSSLNESETFWMSVDVLLSSFKRVTKGWRYLSPVGGGFLYCSMTLWIFSHKTFGSSTLGICLGEWKNRTQRSHNETNCRRLFFFFSFLFQARRDGPGTLQPHQKHWAPSQNNQWPHAMIKVTERLLSPAASPFPQQLKIDEKTLSLFLEFFYPSNYTLLRYSLPEKPVTQCAIGSRRDRYERKMKLRASRESLITW